jgi:hypothetical protein
MHNIYETTSEVTLEARVLCRADAAPEIVQAWLVYDPDPHGPIEEKDGRRIMIAFPVEAIGKAEAEHLIEQAEYDFNQS